MGFETWQRPIFVFFLLRIKGPKTAPEIREPTVAIKMFWWKSDDGVPNFGDELSCDAVRYCSGQDVEHAKIPRAHLVAVGSLLNMTAKVLNNQTQKRIHVWGSGLMHPAVLSHFGNRLITHSVRGPLTRSALGLEQQELPLGDAGLLASRMYATDSEKRYAIGLLPHHTQDDDPRIAALAASLPDCTIISANQQPEPVARAIAECDFVISSSLHGLIVADSLGVPNRWLSLGALHKGGYFKFYDYFLSIERPEMAPLRIEEALADRQLACPAVDQDYMANIPAIQDSIEASFPEKLKAN